MVNFKEYLFKPLYLWAIKNIWFLRPIYETAGTGCPVNYKYFFFQKILGFNRRVPWPVHFTSIVSGEKYITIGFNTAPGASVGNYIFASPEAPIYIGNCTVMASNVCIGSFNHDIYNISQYTTKGGIHIGEYCWIAANSVVLSGVKLGDHTVVAAGAVVNHSFPDGYCVLAGNPAKIVKKIEQDKVVRFTHPYRYIGYKKIESFT
jgi:acetyltransferase-like isoleucine patch superfamily enzyme